MSGYFMVSLFNSTKNCITRSTFVSSVWSFVFSSPPQWDFQLQRISFPDFIHYIYFLILILEKEPVFSLFNFEC